MRYGTPAGNAGLVVCVACSRKTSQKEAVDVEVQAGKTLRMKDYLNINSLSSHSSDDDDLRAFKLFKREMIGKEAALKSDLLGLKEKVEKLELAAVLPSADQVKMDALLKLVPMLEHRMTFLVRDRKKNSYSFKFSFDEIVHPLNDDAKKLFKDYIHLLVSVVPSWITLDSSKHSLIRVENLTVHQVRALISNYYIGSKVAGVKHNAEIRAETAETKLEAMKIELEMMKLKESQKHLQERQLELELDKEEHPPIVASDTESEYEEMDPVGTQWR